MSSLLRALKKRFEIEIDRRHAPAGFCLEGIAHVVRAVDGVVFADEHDGEEEFVALVERVEISLRVTVTVAAPLRGL